jgi:hypothetical protein
MIDVDNLGWDAAVLCWSTDMDHRLVNRNDLRDSGNLRRLPERKL